MSYEIENLKRELERVKHELHMMVRDETHRRDKQELESLIESKHSDLGRRLDELQQSHNLLKEQLEEISNPQTKEA